MMTDDRTHWDGCWREPGHHECAKAMLISLSLAVLAHMSERELQFHYSTMGEKEMVEIAREVLKDE